MEELDRRNDYFERQARQSSLLLASSAKPNNDTDQEFAVELLLLEKTKLYGLIER